MLRPLLKKLSEKFGTHNRTSESTGTIRGKTANSTITRAWDAPWARSSTEPIVKSDGGSFVRLPEGEVPSSDTYHGRGGETWEMWEGRARRSGDAKRTNFVQRDPLNQAERGVVPKGKIHVRHDIELRDERDAKGE